VKSPLLLLGAVTPLVAYCATYLTENQALKAVFPGQTFSKKTLTLDTTDLKKIATALGTPMTQTTVTVWVAPSHDALFIDQVIGKHELITYAVGVGKDGHIKGVEILEYREAYGQQVAGTQWRRQFVDKTVDSPLKMNDDIHNISGATLSSTHVTAGVKRILQTYECVRSRI
jgi:Na+-translocating ferredoxin:NAD+ oxidoreductase RnfG subunit